MGTLSTTSDNVLIFQLFQLKFRVIFVKSIQFLTKPLTAQTSKISRVDCPRDALVTCNLQPARTICTSKITEVECETPLGSMLHNPCKYEVHIGAQERVIRDRLHVQVISFRVKFIHIQLSLVVHQSPPFHNRLD